MIALALLFIVALLRSHAEILRRLTAIEESQARRPGASRHPPPGPGRPPSVSARDIVGETLAGDAVKLALGAGSPRTLLAFLSSGCAACGPLWAGLRRARAAAGRTPESWSLTQGSRAREPRPTAIAGAGGRPRSSCRPPPGEALRGPGDVRTSCWSTVHGAHPRAGQRHQLGADLRRWSRDAEADGALDHRGALDPRSAPRVPSRHSRRPGIVAGPSQPLPISVPRDGHRSLAIRRASDRAVLEFALVGCVVAVLRRDRARRGHPEGSRCSRASLRSVSGAEDSHGT